MPVSAVVVELNYEKTEKYSSALISALGCVIPADCTVHTIRANVLKRVYRIPGQKSDPTKEGLKGWAKNEFPSFLDGKYNHHIADCLLLLHGFTNKSRLFTKMPTPIDQVPVAVAGPLNDKTNRTWNALCSKDDGIAHYLQDEHGWPIASMEKDGEIIYYNGKRQFIMKVGKHHVVGNVKFGLDQLRTDRVLYSYEEAVHDAEELFKSLEDDDKWSLIGLVLRGCPEWVIDLSKQRYDMPAVTYYDNKLNKTITLNPAVLARHMKELESGSPMVRPPVYLEWEKEYNEQLSKTVSNMEDLKNENAAILAQLGDICTRLEKLEEERKMMEILVDEVDKACEPPSPVKRKRGEGKTKEKVKKPRTKKTAEVPDLPAALGQ